MGVPSFGETLVHVAEDVNHGAPEADSVRLKVSLEKGPEIFFGEHPTSCTASSIASRRGARASLQNKCPVQPQSLDPNRWTTRKRWARKAAKRHSNVYSMDAHSESTETARAVKMLTVFDGGRAMTI